jgi:hypothetical protein
MKTIRVGGACAFWGDSSIAAPQLIEGGEVDFLVFDYLAEITMSIMARAREKDPQGGYATDFVGLIAGQLDALVARKIKVISNAGGVNPAACGRALEAKIAAAGHALKVAVVLGDDLLPRQDALRAAGLKDMGDGRPLPEGLLSINAYLGAGPIAAALDAGADIVITGRCVDSAVTLGACMHAFGWSAENLDLMAAGSLAGHILECGAQATGGLHTDWEATGDWANIGYPVAEIAEDGTFVVEKPPGTGGIVTFGTVAEQLVYEIGDPAAYLLPDVTCDFTGVRNEAVGPDRVRVSGGRGLAPTDTYKISATYAEGFRVGMYLSIGGIDAVGKARKVGEAVLRRCDGILRARNLGPYSETSLEVIGAEDAYGPRSRALAARDVILKLAAKHANPKALEFLVRELTSSGTSMSPGITGMGGNRPKVMPVVRLFSGLVDKDDLQPEVELGGRRFAAQNARKGGGGKASPAPAPAPEPAFEGETRPLIVLAFARSGDKGNNANIGVIARKPEYLPAIRAALTPAAVAGWFEHYLEGPVERFELPGVGGLNFLLHDVLAGGGTASLRNDPQGKTYAQILLDFPVPMTPATQTTTRLREENPCAC